MIPVCPTHGLEFVPVEANVHGGVLLVCPHKACQRSLMPDAVEPMATKLPHMDRGRQERRIPLSEASVEEAIRAGCTREAIELLITTVRFKRFPCPRCEEWISVPPGYGYGASYGVPDTIQIPASLPPYIGILTELKGTATPESERQAQLAAQRKIAIVRGVGSRDYTWSLNARVLAYVERILEPSRQAFCVDGEWPALEDL